jgi:hypothetical protein
MALQGNQICQIYDQCAANNIDCGGGSCLNQTSALDPPATCYCNSPLVLVLIAEGKYDCVCSSTTYYYQGGVCVPRPNPESGTRKKKIFLI